MEQAKIIGITEVKPKNSRYNINPAEFTISGFNMFYSNISCKNGRGILLYVHKSLEANEIRPKIKCDESIWVKIKLKRQDQIILGCIYRSPNSIPENNKNLNLLLKEIVNRKASHTLIMGDFNYPNINWENMAITHANYDKPDYHFVETVKECFLFQHLEDPTRFRLNEGANILDLIFTNEEGMVTNPEYHSSLGKSDHLIITLKKFNNLNCYLYQRKQLKEITLFKKGDYQSMNKEMNQINWDQLLTQEQEIDTQWALIKNSILQLQDKYVPKHIIDVNNLKGDFPLDRYIRNKIRKKRTMWKRYMETKDVTKYKQYCKQRNQIKTLVRKSRANFGSNLAKKAKANPKAVWKYLKSKTKIKERIVDLKSDPEDNNAEVISDDTAKANLLAETFSKVFTDEPKENIPCLDQSPISHDFIQLVVTEETVLEQLQKLGISKSPGPDNVHPRIIKELATSLAKPLCILYNASLKAKKIPLDWKHAHVSAIFKKGDKSIASNYRPMSLTCVLCKILEHLIKNHIMHFLELNNLITANQFGFVRGKSTGLQLLELTNKWIQAIDNKEQVDIIFLDIQNAFDTVPHLRLLNKLKSVGIVGPMLEWIRDFLSERVHRVIVGGQKSNLHHVRSGIPQGSVLGPLLFIIYINDLGTDLSSETYLYADDTKLIKNIRCMKDSEELQEDLHKLIDWSNKWLLKFHPEKSKHMLLARKIPTKYTFDYKEKNYSFQLSLTQSEKDLGVIIDSDLEFDQHIYQN